MAEIRKPRRVAFVLLWITTIALVLLWDRSPLPLMVSGVGFITLLFAFSARPWWAWVAALASAGFVAGWGLAFTDLGASQSLVEVYVSVIRGALGQDSPFDGAIVLSYELVLPLLHGLTCLFLIVGLVRARRRA